MLSIKTNKNNCKLTYVPLNVDHLVTGETVNDDITIVTDSGHNLKENDTVSFIRQDGDTISYYKDSEIKEVIDKHTFTIDGFGNYLIGVNGYKHSFISYSSTIFKLDNTTILYTDSGIVEITGDTLDSSNVLKTITAITISRSVKYISEDAFVGCLDLKEITVSDQNRDYSSENGVLFNKNKTELVCYPSQKGELTYNIPSTVEKINNYAFVNAENLTNVTIPSFVKRIGRSAFGSCQNLINVICKPIEAPTISNSTFNTLVLEKIYVKSGYTGTYKSVWKKLKSNIFEDPTIVDDIKINQSNTRLYLSSGNSVVEITGSTLDSGISETYADSLYAIEIGTNVKTIDYFAFGNCTVLTSATIPNTVISIGNNAFYNCRALIEINIPDSVTRIGDYAFAECVNLNNVLIGEGIEYIGKHAFYNIGVETTGNTSVYCEAKEPPVLGDSSVFTSNILEFYVPEESWNTYRGVYMQPNSLIDLTDATTKKYVCFNTNEHIFTINKDYVNKRRRYLWNINSSEYKYDGSLTMCSGDYYIFDDLFLIQNENNTTPICKNIILDITATTVGNEPILLTNCLIGATYDGKDDKYHIYIPYDNVVNVEFIDKLEDNLQNTTFTTGDIRFLCNGTNQMLFGCELQPGANINKVCGNIEVNFNIDNNFEVNLRHDEQIANYVEKVKNESINKIIDYERYQYTPMYYSGIIPEIENGRQITADEYLKSHSSEIDNKLKQVSKIKFRLYFREKDFTLYDDDGQAIDKDSGDTNETDYVDFGTWNTDDSGYWNSYKLRDDGVQLEEVYKNDNLYGDLLGYLGFTDDDVYYQKDALKKSFLRLSFYDSPNRETQKLLYYSTIYFDTNRISNKYIKDLNAWRNDLSYTPRYGQLVFASDIVRHGSFKSNGTSALTAELTCADKYDDTNSSDGFYLHLFDKLVSGNTCTPIYMKAEFNNAKFGKTVPMIRPIFKKSNKPISPINTSFPREYMKYKNNGMGQIYNWTDMDMLLQDMYIKLFIKYDFNTNQYVWFVPQSNLNDTLTFNLFEPRVKGYDLTSYNNAINGYGTDDGTPNWFSGEFNNEHIWINGDGQTEEQWARTFNGCCLMTTATTLQNTNMLKGTRLFNKSAMKKIHSIWIDGMQVAGDSIYNTISGEYISNNIQLPDIPFVGCINGGGTFLWEPETTRELWNDEDSNWIQDNLDVNPKKIHRVNYYFKTNTSDVNELFDELYLGVYNKKKKKRVLKTIEVEQSLAETLKGSISNLTTGEKLPNGMFCGIRSLRCVKTVKNNGYSFTTIGNGAFNNCKSLIRVELEKDTVEIIGKNCFSGCRSLKMAKLTDVRVILREAFQGCYTLARVYFTLGADAKTKYIGCGAFGNTKLRDTSIPHTVIRIANSAYRRCYQLEEFLFGERGNISWKYFYGPNTYYDEFLGELHIGDPDLYTFANASVTYSSQLQTVGKRAFGDCAVSKYNLRHNGGGNKKYTYQGGNSRIIVDLVRLNVVAKFYDARNNAHITLALSIQKDRGKVMYHYKDTDYREYCEAEGSSVLNFEDWLKYVF